MIAYYRLTQVFFQKALGQLRPKHQTLIRFDGFGAAIELAQGTAHHIAIRTARFQTEELQHSAGGGARLLLQTAGVQHHATAL